MSLILVVEREARHVERIEDALTSEGWRVKTVGDRQEAAAAAAEEAPDLVLVSSLQPDAREILDSFGRKGGGPGSIVLLAESAVEVPTPASLGADDLVSKPFTAAELRMVVRRCLARPSAPMAPPGLPSEDKLTSSDIFGDLLDEVEGRPSTMVQPPPDRNSDLDRKIEETLSGVLGEHREHAAQDSAARKGSGEAKRTAKAKSSASTVDQLLSDTLSGLDLGGKKSRRSPSAPPVPPPAPAAVSPPVPVAESSLPPSPAPAAPEPAPPPTSPEEASPEPEALPEIPTAPAGEVLSPVPPQETPLSASPVPHPKKDVGPSDSLEGIESLYATQRIPIKKEESKQESKQASKEEEGKEEGLAKEPAAGEEFGQYTLEERIARGGMAEVWRAKMKGVEGFQKRVAIKRILPHLTDSGDFVDMFIDEAKLAAQLNHSNIIHIYDLGKIGDDYYIAMEYVEGKDLRSILNRARAVERPMPHSLALLIATRLAGALDYAHRKRDFDNRELGLVHRDVSPQNVLISDEGDIKLCDFGIAKAVSKVSKTQMGALKGKLQYMSPEQARGKKVDPRTDIFSLGAVLFEMLTGRRLFPGDSEISVLEAVREGRIVEPREIDSTISPDVNACVVKALAKDPDDRYQTAGELESELNRLLQETKPAVGASDLARYMQEVFSLEALTPVQEEEPEAGASAGKKGTAEKAGQQEFPPLAPAPGATVGEAEARGRGLLYAAIAAVIVLTVAAVFVVRYRMKMGGTAPATVAEASQPGSSAVPAPEQGQPGAAASTPTTAKPGAPEASNGAKFGAAGAPAAKPGAPKTGAAPGKGKAAAAVPPAEVQKLVSQEVQRREDALRKKFEAQQKKLQEELAKTQAEQRKPKAAAKPEAAPAQEKEAASGKVKPSSAKKAGGAPATSGAATADKGASTTVATSGPTAAGKDEPAPKASPPSSGAAAATPPAASASQAEATGTPPPASGPASPPSVATKPAAAPPKPTVRVGELVPMGPGVNPPELVSFSKPPYPPIALRFKVQGTVILSLLVNENGKVDKVRLLRGVKEKVGLNEAAIAAAKKARFKPATKDGVRVKMWFTLTVPFQL